MPELQVYALTSRQAGRVSVRGVMGEPLQAVRIGRIDAIVGRIRARPKPTASNLRRYDRVISALWRRMPALLPARFGTSARDLADLEATVHGRERVVRGRLRAVRNRAQMTVRLVDSNSSDVGRALSGSPGGPAAFARDARYGEPRRSLRRRRDKVRPTNVENMSGTQYLHSRQREYAVPGFDPLRAAVRRWIRDERVEKRGGVATIYHLIPRGSADRYRLTIGDAAREAGVRMIVSGPWPPYAFADVW